MAYVGKFEMGEKVKDCITGFEGKITAVAFYYNGCIRYQVQPPVDKEGKYAESQMVDEQQLEVVEKKKVLPLRKPTGGDRPGLPGYKPI